jgi:hypothetical protein
MPRFIACVCASPPKNRFFFLFYDFVPYMPRFIACAIPLPASLPRLGYVM